MRALSCLFILVVGLLAPVVAAAGAPNVMGHLPCHDYHRLVETLDKRYGETPVSTGLQANGHALQVFTSAKSGSWTILSVSPSGLGCIVAAGRDWRSGAPGPAGNAS